MQILILLLTFCMLSASTLAAPAHRFVCVDNGGNKLIHIDQTGAKKNWTVPLPAGSRDMQLLESNRLLVSHPAGCAIYSLEDGKRLWNMDGFKGVETAQFRPETQEIWLGANTKGAYEFSVLAKDGEWFKKNGQKRQFTGIEDGFLRLARFIPGDGSLIFTVARKNQTTGKEEYYVQSLHLDSGYSSFEALLPGKGFLALRQPDGSFAATTGASVSLVLIDKDRKITKTYLGESFKKQYRLNWFSGFQKIRNGNWVIANWLGHGANGTGPHLIEVDAENRLVWSWEDHKTAKQITMFMILDDTGTSQDVSNDETGETPRSADNGGKTKGHKRAGNNLGISPTDEFARLSNEISDSTNWNIPRLRQETLRPEALVAPEDRTPVDIVWRRTQALLADIRGMRNAPDLTSQTVSLTSLKPAVEAMTSGSKEEDQRALFSRIAALRRQIAFKNPLLDFDKILFLKHHKQVRGEVHMVDQFFGFNQDKTGGVYVLENAFGENPTVRSLLKNSSVQSGSLKDKLLEDNGSFISLDLDYDARQILFAFSEAEYQVPPDASWDNQRWTLRDATHLRHVTHYYWRPEGVFHIFKANIDGSDLTQLTEGSFNEYDPCFMPNGRIAFVSERAGGNQRCGDRPLPAATLHSMLPDGSDMIQLSYHETNEWQPSVDNNGMICYTRWDYVDRDSDVAHHLWLSYPDGRDPRSTHGNYPEVRESRPWMEMSIRAIPNSAKYIATAAPHHGQNYGSLVLLDLRKPDDRSMSQIKRITPQALFPESEKAPGVPHAKGVHNPRSEYFGTAWPLSEDYYLCVFDPKQANYGIYLLDSFGNCELLYRDPKSACLDPIPFKPRPRPPVLPVKTIQAKADQKPGADLSMGTVMVMNIYESEYPWPEGSKIKALRIVNVLEKTNAFVNIPKVGRFDQSLARGVLGTVPVEEDGSVHFRMPAGAEVYFQALDENGMMLQNMRTGTYVHPGETLSCAGCHESKKGSAQAGSNAPLAFKRPPSDITPEVEGSYPLTFPRLVQPVLDAKCVKCHETSRKSPSLRGNRFGKFGWSDAYTSLAKYSWGKSGGNGVILKEGRQYSLPGQEGARVSQLYNLLKKGHKNVVLTPGEIHRITLWLDCNSVFYGAYTNLEKQARGEIVAPAKGWPAWINFAQLQR